jgi:hypothetical protein
VAAASMLAVACASGLYGPLILVPAFVAANVLAFNVALLREHRPWVLGMGLAAMVVPLFLERAGVLPPAMVIGSDSITFLPVIREFHETPVRIGILLSVVAAIVAPSLLQARMARTLDEASGRASLASWQLRQLLPEHARAGLEAVALRTSRMGSGGPR